MYTVCPKSGQRPPLPPWSIAGSRPGPSDNGRPTIRLGGPLIRVNSVTLKEAETSVRECRHPIPGNQDELLVGSRIEGTAPPADRLVTRRSVTCKTPAQLTEVRMSVTGSK